jgi:hypothetical protein
MWELVFDRSRPFGPLEDDETCTVGRKAVSFDAKAALGYTHGVQLSPLSPKPTLNHVFSLKITGLKQEYGWNAVAVVMNKFDGNRPSDDMFTVERGRRPAPHDLWIYSQFTCPWKDTLLTLIVSPNDSKVDAYVEQLLDGASSTADDGVHDDSSKKRKRATDGKDDTAMPYLPKDEAHLWTDLGDGLKRRSFEAGFMNKKLPNIGVLLCGCLGNRAEIAPASPRVVEACEIAKPLLVLYA